MQRSRSVWDGWDGKREESIGGVINAEEKEVLGQSVLICVCLPLS